MSIPSRIINATTPILIAALLTASCEDPSSSAPAPTTPTETRRLGSISGPSLTSPLSDLKEFSCIWTRLEPIHSSTVHLDSMGVLTASRPRETEGNTTETRTMILDSATTVAVRDSLLLPVIFQAPPLVERDPYCADGVHTSYDILVSGRERVRLVDQGCHLRNSPPEGYGLADRVARSLFERAFPSE